MYPEASAGVAVLVAMSTAPTARALMYIKGSLRSPRVPASRRVDAPVFAPFRPGRRTARGRDPEERASAGGRSVRRL
jgi:hypothetical protein